MFRTSEMSAPDHSSASDHSIAHFGSSLLGPATLVAVVVAGLSIGYFWPASDPPGDQVPGAHAMAPTVDEPPVPSLAAVDDLPLPSSSATGAAGGIDLPSVRGISAFPLSAFDRRDQQQAPAVASDGGKRVWAAWESQTGPTERTLFLAASVDGGATFAGPRPLRRAPIHVWDVVVRGERSQRSSRLWPRLAFAAGTLYLSWVDSPPEDVSRLALRYAVSQDGGETFSEPIDLSSPAAVRPTFVDMTADSAGRLAASWLDHRGGAQQVYCAVTDGNNVDERLVEAGPDGKGVCPCCTTAVLLAGSGELLVGFRNQRQGFRDIWIAAAAADATNFSPAAPAAENCWKFDGCPHDGPALASVGESTVVAWMDARSGVQQVYCGVRSGAELPFETRPLAPAPDRPQGHPELLVDRSGALHAVWDEAVPAESSAAATADDKSPGSASPDDESTPGFSAVGGIGDRSGDGKPSAGKPDDGEPGDCARGGPASDAPSGPRRRSAEPGHRHGPADGSGRAIRHAISVDGGRTFAPSIALASRPGSFQTRPTICLAADGQLVVAWMEQSETGKRMVVQRVDVPSSELAGGGGR